MTIKLKAFENIDGKGDNANNQHFLTFIKCFLPYLIQIPSFDHHSEILSSTKALIFDQSENLSFSEEFYHTTKMLTYPN